MTPVKPPKINLSLDTVKGPALALGVVLLLVGLGSWLVNGFDTPTRILLAVGVLLAGVFVAIDPEDVWKRLTSRGSLYSGNTLLLGAAALGIIGLLNVVAQNRHQRWDLTANKQYSLSDQTVKVLEDLPQAVQVSGYFQDDDSRKQDVQDLLKEYNVRSGGKVSVEFVDPDKEPARAQQAGVKEYGTTIMTMGDRRQTVTGSRESDFTTALLRLINPTQKKLYFITGHNERKIDGFEQENYGQLKTSLESDNFVVEPLFLGGATEVPTDASAIVLAAPRNPLTDTEKSAMKNYLEAGGKALFLTQPSAPNQPQVSLNDLVSKWNLEISSLPVAEGNPQFVLLRDPLTPAVAKFPNHKITEGLGFAFFPFTTYINVPKDNTSGATITPLAQTSDRSWGETDPRTVRFDDGTDPKGPLTVALAIEDSGAGPGAPPGADTPGTKKTRVVIIGSANFVANAASQIGSSNRDMFLNAANWLAEDESLIGIRPKDRDDRKMFLTGAQSNLVLFSSTVFIPLIVLAMGGFVWWSRR